MTSPKHPQDAHPHAVDSLVFQNDQQFGNWTSVEYVGEGAANVVFKAVLHPQGPKPHELDDKVREVLTKYLFRVPKQPSSPDKPLLHPRLQLQFFLSKILPRFNSNRERVLVDHLLCEVPQDTIMSMRQALEKLDASADSSASSGAPHQRPAKFVGNTIQCPGRVAMLVEDMRPRRSSEKTIEFKPKWLAQSPSAPQNANTCRCCALASQKYSGGHQQKFSPAKFPCPLWLDPGRPTPAGKEKIRDNAIKELFQGDKHYADLYRLLKEKSPVLRQLKDIQLLDARGALGTSKDDEGFNIAMTFRDCSLFVRYSEKNGRVDDGTFEAKLADLDQKNGTWKFGDWQERERSLNQGNWYTGRGEMKNCALWK